MGLGGGRGALIPILLLILFFRFFFLWVHRTRLPIPYILAIAPGAGCIVTGKRTRRRVWRLRRGGRRRRREEDGVEIDRRAAPRRWDVQKRPNWPFGAAQNRSGGGDATLVFATCCADTVGRWKRRVTRLSFRRGRRRSDETLVAEAPNS